MKKISRFLILTLLSFCIVLPAFAWRSTTYYIKDSLKYCVREDSSYVMVSVMDVDAGHRLPVTEDSTLVIPASVTIEGRTYEISDIESDAFCNHLEIKHLIISEGISGIQAGAFRRCANLKSIHLPSSLYCLNATSFAFCSRVEEIIVNKDNETFDSRDHCDAVINTADSTLVLGCQRTKIPKGVTAIGQCAFMGRLYLDSLTIPEGVRRIESGALRYCSGLRYLSLPESLESLGDLALDGCSNLQKLHFSSSMREIGHSVFSGCDGLREITVSPKNKWFDSREHCNAIIRTSEDSLVTGCGQSTIVEGIRRIGDDAFWGSSLSKIYIPSSVTYIGERAFINSRFCSSIEVSPDNPVYDSRENCNAIIESATGILVKGCGRTVIPPDIKQIGGYAFHGMTMPKGLVIPEGVTDIGHSAFSGCDIHTLTLPASLRKIGNYAFCFCPRLETVEAESPELYIGRSAFQFCYSLQSVRLPQTTIFADSEVFRYSLYQEVFEREYGRR